MAATTMRSSGSEYHGSRRSRQPSGSDLKSTFPPTSNSRPPPANHPAVEYTKQVERMRTHRFEWPDNNETTRTSSIDRSGASSPVPLYSSLNSGSSYLRGSTRITAPTTIYINGRTSILEPTDVLKPVVTSSPYVRAHSRTPSVSDRYDNSRSSSLARHPAYSRESSTDRARDTRSNKLGRKVQSTDVSDDDDVSVASTTRGRFNVPDSDRPSSTTFTNSRQSLASLKDSAYSGSSKPGSLQRYDSTSSLRSSSGRTSSGFPASISANTLQRYDSLTSVDGPKSSRRSSRGDLSVNFDLAKSDSYKRERSPVVAMLSRVAVERELPVTKRIGGNVESRYVVGKFPAEASSSTAERIVPIQILSEQEPKRSTSSTASMERSSSANAGFPQSKECSKPPPAVPYGRLESRERVVGGKQFVPDASANDSSSEEEEKRLPNSILRAGSPPRTPRVQLQMKKSVSMDDSEKAGLIGLKNLGNTCFMNAILQSLSNTHPVRDYCLRGEHEQEVNTTTSRMKGSLISAFASVLEALWKRHTSYSSTSPYVPDRFHRQVQQYAPRFSGYLQQDSQEFLRYLLEGLHEDVNRVDEKPPLDTSDIPENLSDAQKASEAWKRYLKRDNSKIVDLFVGQLKSSLICESCDYCSVTFDPFWDLSLPIPSSRSTRRTEIAPATNLYECFKLFTKEETLDGEESPTCAHCKTKQKCRKFFTIQRFPKYFVIHLKRFSQERFRAKLSTLVEYPVDGLDLSEFASESYTGPHPLYSLYAVACHSGSTHCGHYTAFCRHPVSKKWNEYNDARVSPASEEDVVTSEAYVLFYQLTS
ncbi:hypothetical protein RvY_01219 [Ramazzottius varieornatus]|uniref:Ubiquitin carboxyl-terminal hydrolase n=1 Tax=Ramazzottius varieornatus TaxID=947166 RepID=A0A1D1UFW8_RAMVA|nr:hypothetical protein RvY_01219 [Ramazzottius varieornatus]